jgi:hypothetical protein
MLCGQELPKKAAERLRINKGRLEAIKLISTSSKNSEIWKLRFQWRKKSTKQLSHLSQNSIPHLITGERLSKGNPR